MLLNAGCEKEQNLAHHEHYETAYISGYQPLQRRCDAGLKDDGAGQGRILTMNGIESGVLEPVRLCQTPSDSLFGGFWMKE